MSVGWLIDWLIDWLIARIIPFSNRFAYMCDFLVFPKSTLILHQVFTLVKRNLAAIIFLWDFDFFGVSIFPTYKKRCIATTLLSYSDNPFEYQQMSLVRILFFRFACHRSPFEALRPFVRQKAYLHRAVYWLAFLRQKVNYFLQRHNAKWNRL